VRIYLSGRKVQMLTEAIGNILGYVRDLADQYALQLPAIKNFADVVKPLVDGLKGAMDLFSELVSTSINFRTLTAQGGPLERLVGALAGTVEYVKAQIGRQFQDEGVGAFSQAVSSMVSALKGGLELLSDLGANINLADTEDAKELAGQVVQIYLHFKAALERAFQNITESVGLAEQIGQISEQIGKAIGVLSETLSLLKDLSDSSDLFTFTDPLQFLDTFIDDMVQVIRAFRARQGSLTAALASGVAGLAEPISKAMGGLKDSLDFLTGLFDYRPVGAGKIESFFNALRELLQRFVPLSQSLGDEALKAARAFGDNVGPAMGVLKDALDIFLAMTGQQEIEVEVEQGRRRSRTHTRTKTSGGLFKPVNPAVVDSFINSVKQLLVQLGNGTNRIPEELLAYAKRFGDRIAPAVAVLKDALDILLNIMGDTQTETERGSRRSRSKTTTKGGIGGLTQQMIDTFIGSVYRLLEGWGNLIRSPLLSGDFDQRSNTMAQVLSTIITALTNSMAMLSQMGDATGEGGDNINNVFAALTTAWNNFTLSISGSVQNLVDPNVATSVVARLVSAFDPNIPTSVPAIWRRGWEDMALATFQSVESIIRDMARIPGVPFSPTAPAQGAQGAPPTGGGVRGGGGSGGPVGARPTPIEERLLRGTLQTIAALQAAQAPVRPLAPSPAGPQIVQPTYINGAVFDLPINTRKQLEVQGRRTRIQNRGNLRSIR
jgi:hypothetical protein